LNIDMIASIPNDSSLSGLSSLDMFVLQSSLAAAHASTNPKIYTVEGRPKEAEHRWSLQISISLSCHFL
jgi:hypothetical protein